MGNTHASLYYHLVFATKNREPFLSQDIQSRLWPYLGGIARQNGFVASSVGGHVDHIHMLISLRPALAVSKAVQLVKAGSSKWVSEQFPTLTEFRWQEGYGIFTISISDVARTKFYIAGQAEHHKKQTFQNEFVAFLERHNLAFDPANPWASGAVPD